MEIIKNTVITTTQIVELGNAASLTLGTAGNRSEFIKPNDHMR